MCTVSSMAVYTYLCARCSAAFIGTIIDIVIYSKWGTCNTAVYYSNKAVYTFRIAVTEKVTSTRAHRTNGRTHNAVLTHAVPKYSDKQQEDSTRAARLAARSEFGRELVLVHPTCPCPCPCPCACTCAWTCACTIVLRLRYASRC